MDHPVNPCSSPACTFNDLFINCKGNCRQRFHAVCVGLSSQDVPAIISSPNLFWFCDGCRDEILTFRAAVRPPEHPVGGEMSCGTKKCIFTDQLIRCDGPCGKDFHGMCVRLDKTDLAVIESSVNILWVCDGCKGDGRGESDEDPAEEPAELEPEHQDVDDSMVVRLDTKFKSIIEKLTRLSNNLEKGVYTPPDSLSNSEGSSSEDEDSHEMNATVVESGTTLETADNKAASKVMEAEVEEIVDNRNADLIKNNSESPVKDTDQCPKIPDCSTKKDQDEPKTDQSPRKDFPKLQIFTFGGSKQVESPVTNINFSFSKPIDCVEKFKNILKEQKNKPSKPNPAKLVEPKKDENNNSSKPEIPPEETAPKKVELAPPPIQLAKKVDSNFALWIKFNDPDISSNDACSVIRQALGMSSHEPISARNVVPGHIRFTGQACYASFKVDLDAFWRKKALDGATWKSVQDYMEHAEWINRW